MFPLSVCWCNQGPKSPKGLRTQGGNYHQTLRSSFLLENSAMFSFLTLFISSFQSLCRGTLFWDLVHVGDFIDTLATRRGWTCWLPAIQELVLWCPRKRIYWGEVATQILRSFAVNLELFEAWKRVRIRKHCSPENSLGPFTQKTRLPLSQSWWWRYQMSSVPLSNAYFLLVWKSELWVVFFSQSLISTGTAKVTSDKFVLHIGEAFYFRNFCHKD